MMSIRRDDNIAASFRVVLLRLKPKGANLTAKDAVAFDFPDHDPACFRATAASACICVHLWFHLWRALMPREPATAGFRLQSNGTTDAHRCTLMIASMS
jgi:hypothetical protein